MIVHAIAKLDIEVVAIQDDAVSLLIDGEIVNLQAGDTYSALITTDSESVRALAANDIVGKATPVGEIRRGPG